MESYTPTKFVNNDIANFSNHASSAVVSEISTKFHFAVNMQSAEVGTLKQCSGTISMSCRYQIHWQIFRLLLEALGVLAQNFVLIDSGE